MSNQRTEVQDLVVDILIYQRILNRICKGFNEISFTVFANTAFLGDYKIIS